MAPGQLSDASLLPQLNIDAIFLQVVDVILTELQVRWEQQTGELVGASPFYAFYQRQSTLNVTPPK